MSHYAQKLSLFDQETLDRPDIRPLLHPNWLPETTAIEEGRHACLLSSIVTIGRNRGPTAENVPGIRRRDVDDLRRVWLKNNYGNTDNPSLLSGYWVVDNWEFIGKGSIVIIQYRTLRVCLRGGSEAVVIGTADIDNILLLCLQETQGKEMPPCLGTLLCKNKGLQWLILPVETAGSSGLKAYVQGFRTTLCRAPAQLRASTRQQILAEMASRWRDRDFHKFEELLWQHGINWQQVEEAEVEYRHSRGGYESLLVYELEILFNIAGTGSDGPGPLPLTADRRAQLIITLQGQMTDLIREREQVENDVLNSLKCQLTAERQEALHGAVDRCMALLEEKHQIVQYFGGEHLRTPVVDQDADSTYFSGEGSSNW